MISRFALTLLIVVIACAGAWLLGLGWLPMLGAAIISSVVGLIICKPFTSSAGDNINIDTRFITCPNCGTRNPRHSKRIYECYHCGRDFSELSGRHPTLPGKVSGTPDKD